MEQATPSVARMIDDLREGPFAAWGGAWALAQAIGVDPASVSLWRSGKRSPKYTNLQALKQLWREHFGTGETE